MSTEEKVAAAAGVMFKYCVEIAINEGCGAEYEGASTALFILYRRMGWDVVAMKAKLDKAVDALYEVAE